MKQTAKEAEMDDICLKLSGLSKRYLKGAALTDVELTLKRGRVYALVGVQGSGKTTLYRILTGLIKQDAGTVELFGVTGRDLQKARKQIGALVDIPTYNTQLSIRQNLIAQSITLGKVDRKRIDTLLKAMNITKDVTGSRKMSHCTTGIRQNFAVVSAFLGAPALLLLDEVFSGLDKDSTALFLSLLKQEMAEREMTVLLSGPLLPDLLTVATDFIFIDQGKLKGEYTRAQLLELLPENPETGAVNALYAQLTKEAEA
jgi:ABC-2 type transport system ATP-binding protein